VQNDIFGMSIVDFREGFGHVFHPVQFDESLVIQGLELQGVGQTIDGGEVFVRVIGT
jgi:hypothetical protein